MNKYLVIIPYDCVQNGEMSCFVYAENEEEAFSKAEDRINWQDEEYEDGDQNNFTYNYENLRVSVDTLYAVLPEFEQTHNNFHQVSHNTFNIIPEYFLAELHLI